ncbi:MAG: hypothetical protein AB1586_02270 [Pseudomonadota bacterium]
MWFALICFTGLGAVAAIWATTPSAPVAPPSEQHAEVDDSFAPERAAKADRLPPVKTQEAPAPQVAIVPAAEPPIVAPDLLAKPDSAPAKPTTADADETPRRSAETRPHRHRRWQDAKAKLVTTSPRHRHIRPTHARTEAANDPSKATVNAPPCQQDAMSGLMRALNLSPRCGP